MTIFNSYVSLPEGMSNAFSRFTARESCFLNINILDIEDIMRAIAGLRLHVLVKLYLVIPTIFSLVTVYFP